MASGINDGDEPEFQIAPMIDVLLVLLIFFMSITTMQVARVDQKVELPSAPNSSRQENQKEQTVINVRWDPATRKASYSVEKEVYFQLDPMIPFLRARIAHSPGHLIVVRGDRLVPAEYIGEVVSTLGLVGAGQISFATLSR
jgi:biopolymer transport protein ExbD